MVIWVNCESAQTATVLVSVFNAYFVVEFSAPVSLQTTFIKIVFNSSLPFISLPN